MNKIFAYWLITMALVVAIYTYSMRNPSIKVGGLCFEHDGTKVTKMGDCDE